VGLGNRRFGGPDMPAAVRRPLRGPPARTFRKPRRPWQGLGQSPNSDGVRVAFRPEGHLALNVGR